MNAYDGRFAGYGTPAPVTMSGRIFCVLYGMFGIPLTLMTVADVAKFLANIFLKQFIRISTLKKRCRDRPGTASLSVPLKSATCIFLLYPPLAAAFLSWWEQWSYGDSLYFCFISVLTIGFGDMKPSNDKFFIVTILFVVMGLVITTMCLDLVAGFYIDKVHFFGRHYSLAKMLAQMIMDNAAGRLKGRKSLHATIGLNSPIVPDTYG
uniref:Potassium channel domain-containing protein n=1 Tax=Plectus sambesii TaxID=2011161 RepID=A0A914V582_9BILA